MAQDDLALQLALSLPAHDDLPLQLLALHFDLPLQVDIPLQVFSLHLALPLQDAAPLQLLASFFRLQPDALQPLAPLWPADALALMPPKTNRPVTAASANFFADVALDVTIALLVVIM